MKTASPPITSCGMPECSSGPVSFWSPDQDVDARVSGACSGLTLSRGGFVNVLFEGRAFELFQRSDLDHVVEVAAQHGFGFRHSAGVDMLGFRCGPPAGLITPEVEGKLSAALRQRLQRTRETE